MADGEAQVAPDDRLAEQGARGGVGGERALAADDQRGLLDRVEDGGGEERRVRPWRAALERARPVRLARGASRLARKRRCARQVPTARMIRIG